MGLGLEAIQGMTNAMNAIANQVIRNSGGSGRNAGWPYFNGTFRDYPAFKRKFESFQMTYDERMMDYYVTLQAHIEEARSAGALDMLLIPANVELMVLPLTTWEKRVWREAQGRLPAEDRPWYMDVFVNERLRYAINMVDTSERHVLPKATPYHRSQRSRLRRAEAGDTAAPDRPGGTQGSWP
jgi:hypothetical protein